MATTAQTGSLKACGKDWVSSRAHYDLAVPGTFHLVPPVCQVAELARDYTAIREMFYREPPAFVIVLQDLSALQAQINGLNERFEAEPAL